MKRPALVCAALLALTTTACGSGGTSRDAPERSVSVSTDQSDVDAAIAFGNLVLPPESRVLGIEHASALDEAYDLSLTTDDNGLRMLLSDSHFDAPLAGGFVQYPKVAVGPELEVSPLITTTMDRGRTPDGIPTARHVRVDKRDPATIYVHIKVATTP